MSAAPPSRHPARVRLRLALAAVLALVVVPPPTPAAAQAPVREVQTAVAPDVGVTEIDARLRRDLGLFPEVDGFVVARLYDVVGDGWVLELTVEEDGRTVRERRPLSDAALRELRGRVAEALAARGLDRAVTSDGRGGLVLAETALGLGFYGWAVPTVLDIQSDRAAVAAYLLTAGASFLVPYRLTRSITVTEAHRDAVVWGGTRGIAYGALLGDAFTLGDDDDPLDVVDGGVYEEDDDERVILGLAMATSLAGSVLGYQAVDPARHDRGDVALWSTGGDFALAYGFGAAVALGLYDDEVVCREDVCEDGTTDNSVAGHLTTVALGAAGTYGARLWAERSDYTVGDARALLSFGVLGAHAALPLAWAVFDDRNDGERGLAAALVAGSAGALWLGDRSLRGRSLTPGEGLLVQAGHLAGGLLAAGVTYLVDDDTSDSEVLYMSTTAAGALAGSLLTYRAVVGDGGSGVGAARGGTTERGPAVELNASGLMSAWLARDGSRTVRIPLVTVHH